MVAEGINLEEEAFPQHLDAQSQSVDNLNEQISDTLFFRKSTNSEFYTLSSMLMPNDSWETYEAHRRQKNCFEWRIVVEKGLDRRRENQGSFINKIA